MSDGNTDNLNLVPTPGNVLPYLGMVGRLRGGGPLFWDFRSDWIPSLCLISM